MFCCAGLSVLNCGMGSISNLRSALGERFENSYFIKERAVFHGFPIAVISAVAFGCLAQTGTWATNAVFGAINYTVLTTLIELYNPYSVAETRGDRDVSEMRDNIVLGMMFLVAYGVSHAFINNVWKMPLNYTQGLILAASALAGQLARSYAMNIDSEDVI